jgi:hypothetical protein
LMNALPAMVSPAQAQQQRPNIVVIMGDDIGWSNIGPITKASWPAERLVSTAWPLKACASPTIMRRRVALPDGRTSSPARCRFAPALRQSDRLGHRSASR